MKAWQANATGGDESGKKTGCTTKRAAESSETAARAIQMLTAVDTSPMSSQQVAVLVSGSLLMCSWQYISQGLQHFESKGLQCLMEVWAVVAASFGLGQLAKVMARSAGVNDAAAGSFQDQDNPSSASSSSSMSSYLTAVQDNNAVEKDGLETVEPDQQDDEEQDEVTVQKKIAQAEAAAKLAEYQDCVRQLLATISNSSDISSSTNALFKLADQLFNSPMNVNELVNQGGVPVVMAAARSALRSLASQQSHAQVLPALLQVSWVLLQIAHSPPACCAALSDQDVASTLLEVTKAVVAAPAEQPDAKEAILRNLCWIMLLLCDTHSSANKSKDSAQPAAAEDSVGAGTAAAVACASALSEAGAVDVLQQLVSLQFGVSPGWVAAATLGLFCELGQQQRQQQESALCVAAAQAMLHADSLHGLGYLLNHQPQLCDRLQGLVYRELHYLLTSHAAEVLHLLIQEHLVGTFATAVPPKLARLLVCQLLSSRGQEVIASIEAEYELDAPLALAQIIPLPVHLKLPSPPSMQKQQQQLVGEIQAADDMQLADQPLPSTEAETTPLAAPDDVYTDILACRLLLQHERLAELVMAFADELLEQQQEEVQRSADFSAAAAAAGQAEPGRQLLLPPVCDAVLNLIEHLMSRDLQLQAAQHMRGDSIDDSQSSVSSSAASSSGSSAIDLALAAPDASGVYSSVMQGLVPPQRLPAAAAATSGDAACSNERSCPCSTAEQQQQQDPLQLPQLPVPARSTSSSSRSVVFQFDQLQHVVPSALYKQIRNSSKMINSILSREGKRPSRPVTVFSTPHFTAEANCWVLQCLERWLSTGQLSGFTAQQAAKLWVAADFWQVDGLQVACEDVIAAAAASNAAQLQVALELCSRHRAGGLRLQRLAAQVLMRGLADAKSLGNHSSRVLEVQQLLGQYKGVLVPGLLSEIRDRMVTLCMLNAGLDDDTPEDMVE